MTEREMDELMQSMREHHEWQLRLWQEERQKELLGYSKSEGGERHET